METENKIFIGIGVVLAGFFGYRYWKKKKDEKDLEKTTTKTDNTETGSSGFSDYEKKVMNLQTKLGISVDGKAGPQTNKTVQTWFPTLFAKLGNVSPTNVDQYIAAKKENVFSSERLRQVWNAMGSGTPAKILKDTQVSAYYYDSASKLYKATGGYFIVKQGTSIYKSNSTLLTNGILTTLPVFLNNGSSAGSKQVLINPDSVYVP